MKTCIALLLALWLPLAQAEEAEEPKGGGEGASIAYLTLTPPLVGNYGSGERLKYFKADVSLRTDSAEAKSKVAHHEPLIRNQLVMLFAQQDDASLGSVEGKERLRQEALKQVQAVLQQEEGQPLVTDLLFNNLIVQP